MSVRELPTAVRGLKSRLTLIRVNFGTGLYLDALRTYWQINLI